MGATRGDDHGDDTLALTLGAASETRPADAAPPASQPSTAAPTASVPTDVSSVELASSVGLVSTLLASETSATSAVSPSDAGVGEVTFGTDASEPCALSGEGSRVTLDFDATNPERVVNLQWLDSDGVSTGNLVAEGGPLVCGTEPLETFGQSYGFPEGTTPVPVASNTLGTLTVCGLNATISTTPIDCTGAYQTPVTTVYERFGGQRSSQVRVTRTIGFDAATPMYTGIGVRPFVPRLPVGSFTQTIFPLGSAEGIATVSAAGCPGDCLTQVGDGWNGQWLAQVAPASGYAMILLRDPQMTAPVQGITNWDSYSNANLSSFGLIQPDGGWKAPITEVEWMCFEDLTSWPEEQRAAGQLPADCQPQF